MQHLRCYHLAVSFYRLCQSVQLPCHLKQQLNRASSSIALNLAEGCGKRTVQDQKRFFQIALGSTRECQAISALHSESFSEELHLMLDHLGAAIYKLLKRAG